MTEVLTVGRTVRRDQALALSASRAAVGPWGFLEWFIISQVALPALLYLPGTQGLRVPIRIAPFAISLAALVWWWVKEAPRTSMLHPACRWLVGAMICLVVMVLHPTTNSLLTGFGQVMLYASVLAPVFWTPCLVRGTNHLARLLTILLVCNGINALVGILQVYDPEQWMPAELSQVVTQSYDIRTLSYQNAEGKIIWRPPGLSDNPGAVCGPATVAALLGIILCCNPGAPWKKVFGLGFGVAGVTAVWLSLVRTNLLILAGSLLVYAVVLLMQRQVRKLILFLGLTGAIALAAFSLAQVLGGRSVLERFNTLLEADPLTLYFTTGRAGWLTHGFSHYLAEYPLGAGLGRWGMIRYYFGDLANRDAPLIFAELQIIAWILDGGFILPLLYGLALLTATLQELRLVRSVPDQRLRSWAAVVFAVQMGTIALVFGFIPFTSPVGLQYWFLAGALHGALQKSGEQKAEVREQKAGARSHKPASPIVLGPLTSDFARLS